MDLFVLLLFLHALGAIVAFGPGFAAMVVGPMVAREPQHANFYARTQVATARRIVMPVSISMAVTGVGMILDLGWENITGGRHWLEVGILIYVAAIIVSIAVQAPAGAKLVALTSTLPAPGTPPPPEIQATVGRIRVGGMLLSAMVVAIAFLMVTKPF